MKKFYAILFLAIASLTQLQAQAPQGFNYQATVRNASGDLIVNQNVSFSFNVIQGSQAANPTYSEDHTLLTDDLGQVSLVIGQGIPTTGVFSEIDWSIGNYYLAIELDTGNGFEPMGTSQLLSMPYAMYSNNSGSSNELPSGGSNGQVLTVVEGVTTWVDYQELVDISGDNPCIYEQTLTTEAATDITETSATLNGVISIVSENCEVPNNSEQGFVYSTEIQPTLEDIQVNVNGTNISTNIEGLTPNTTYYVRAFLTNNFGDFYGDEVSFSTNEVPCDIVYLAENGITIKACEDANIGDVGIVNDVSYIVVDRAMLDEMIANDEDLTVVCTTRVIDMLGLFFIDSDTFSDFNQDISSWDVSNVTNMTRMFYKTNAFNQPLGNWDVSNVTSMGMVFSQSSFNQPIGNWDVSNVTNMGSMFLCTLNSNISVFNQDISNWDVSSVTFMGQMFWGAESFNQPIGNWDVSNVTNMANIFVGATSFNQPIGSWDVSNVTNMKRMFNASSSFNQDISSWDVSNVTDMSMMFGGAESFNQPIGNWDVSNVTDMYAMFYNASAFNQDISAWNVSSVNGMSSMFYSALSFNQDIGTWDVSNILSCSSFSTNTPQWTLPKPNFTQCTQ